jgi:hypothetical protein
VVDGKNIDPLERFVDHWASAECLDLCPLGDLGPKHALRRGSAVEEEHGGYAPIMG